MASEEEFRGMDEWYNTHKEELLDKYKGQYVAIIPDENGQYGVRYSGEDKETLRRRIPKGDYVKPILIKLVEKEEPTARIRERPRLRVI